MRLVQHLLGNVEDFYKTGIYKISFSDKQEYAYIGSAFVKSHKSKSQRGIYVRLNHHLGALKRNKHPNSYLQRVFNKHAENIVFEVLEVLEDSTNRESIESLWMEKYRETHTLLNLTPETKLSGRLKPLSIEIKKRMGAASSKALKGRIPLNLEELHTKSRRKVEEYSLSNQLLNTFTSLGEFCDHYQLPKRYCSYYLRKQNTLPKIPNKTFKYLNSETLSERSGLKFRVIDDKANETISTSLNDLCILLNTNSTTLRRKNVKEKAIFYKNYIVCPINPCG